MRRSYEERRIVLAVGGPHDGKSVLVHGEIPLERVIDRCMYVLDEDGTPDHPGPVYVFVGEDI